MWKEEATLNSRRVVRSEASKEAQLRNKGAIDKLRSFQETKSFGQSHKSSTFKSHLKAEGGWKSRVLLPAHVRLHCTTKSDTGDVVQHEGCLSLPKSQMFLATGKLSSAPWHLFPVAASKRMGPTQCAEGQVAHCSGFFRSLPRRSIATRFGSK